jgi:putative membrane protein
MPEIVSLLSIIGVPFVVLDGGDFGHMMDMGHMMDWWGIPFLGFWWIAVWVVQLILALLVYKDAEKQEKNGLLWFLLVIIPWIGILFLFGYLVVRSEETDTKEAAENAQRIIDERYAKGEITRAEYLQMKKDIEKRN